MGRLAQGFFALFALYHVARPSLWLVPIDVHLAIHLCGVLATTFFILGSRSDRTRPPTVLDAILAILAVLLGIYFVSSAGTMEERTLLIVPLSVLQTVTAAALMVLLFAAARRAVGLPFVLIMCGFILLMLLGPYLPGLWSHEGMTISEVLDLSVWTSLQGIWGIPLRMSATIIAPFFVFGKLMQHSGVGQLITSVSEGLAGGSRGGPAKVAVVGSALVGSVTGGPATNITMTGSLTIPMMKRIGYRAYYAGAVEAAASSGASIVPPVMTGIAFIMAELTGTSYARLMLLALIPAALYYTCLLIQVHLQAIHTGMKAEAARPDLAALRKEVAARGHLLVPIVVLIVLLVRGYYPGTAVLWAIVSVPLASALRTETRMGGAELVKALAEAVPELVRVAPVCALSGIVLVALFQTGIGSAFTHVVSTTAGDSLLLVALLGAAACLVLGTGTPPIPAYLMTVLIVAPLMVKSGIPLLVAHFFSLYYANLAFITPPIAVGALVAAGVAGASFWSVSVAAVRLAAAGFTIPLVFVYRPALLLYGSTFEVVWAVSACVALVVCFAAALEGWMFKRLRGPERILLVAAGVALIPPNPLINTLAVVAVAAVAFTQVRDVRKRRSQSPA